MNLTVLFVSIEWSFECFFIADFRRARDEEFERGGPPRGDRERDRDRDEAYRPAPLRTRGDGGRDFGGDRDRERDSMRGGGGGMGREDRFRPAPDDFRCHLNLHLLRLTLVWKADSF